MITQKLLKVKQIIFGLLIGCSAASAQTTTIISPSDSGGFEMGTGSFADNGWTVLNASASPTTAWTTGSGKTSGLYSFPTTSRCAFITADGGTSWNYLGTSQGSVHFYRDVTIPAGQTNAILSFKYQQNGATSAKLLVYVCPTNLTPVVGQPTGGNTTIGTNGWGTVTSSGPPVLLVATNANAAQAPGNVVYSAAIPQNLLNNCSASSTLRLVFTWTSNTNIPVNPPAAIDEISLVSSVPVSASSGTFTIDNTSPTSGTNFNNFTDAINWINAVAYCGLSNSVTFNVKAGQTFNENPPAVTSSGTSAYPIVFQRSGAGANPKLAPTGTLTGTADFGIGIHGADYITFDGIDVVSTTSDVEFGYLVRNASGTNGAQYNTIKNATIVLDRLNVNSRCVMQSSSSSTNAGGGVGATSSAGANSNNAYYNLTLGNAGSGIVFTSGASSNSFDSANTIYNNIIGRPTVTDDIGGGQNATIAGISVASPQNISIHDNKITNVTSSATIDGLLITGTAGFVGTNNSIYNNFITYIRQSSTTSTSVVTGMRLAHITTGAVTVRVYNNVINNITASYTSAAVNTRIIKGIHLSSTTAPNTVNYYIVNNTVIVDGTNSPTASSIVLEANSIQPIYTFRNNNFSNITGSQSGAAVHVVMGVIVTGTGNTGSDKFGAAGSISNYNNLHLANTTNGHIGAYISAGTTVSYLTTFANYKANYTTITVDVNSVSGDPLFNNAPSVIPFFGSVLKGTFPSLTSPFNIDILGVSRSSTNSTIGAYESVSDALAPVIHDTTLVNVFNTSNRTLTGVLSVTDNSAVNVTSGTSPRLYFKKSTDNNSFGLNDASTNGWKWVEAGNSTSPFNFTIDYSIINGGSVTYFDTIQYFFVAQDTLSTSPNVAAIPSTGFVGTSVSNISSVPSALKSYVIYDVAASFVDAIVTQASTLTMEKASSNNVIIRVAVETGSTGTPAYVNGITFNTVGGGNDSLNLLNAKVWYTGTNPTFSATAQFGSTYTFAPTATGTYGRFTVNGSQLVPNGTSYFWLTYGINSATKAVSGDSVDAIVDSIQYEGTLYASTTPSASGNRVIKSAYCVPAIASGGQCILNVSFNTLNNSTSSCALPYYTNFAPTGTATTTLLKGVPYNLSVTTSTSSTARINAYIDYNDNGVFETNETIAISSAASIYLPSTVSVTIPCSVTATQLRMRIRSASVVVDACTGSNASEVEDYTLTIQDNPASYVSGPVTQYGGTVAPATNDMIVAHIPLVAQGCGISTITEIQANTMNTTNPFTSITAAHLYATGNTKTFNTSKLLATVANPSGTFTFNSFIDTVLHVYGDTNNYWITYDIASGAAVQDTIDISIDNILMDGQNHTPANNNPAEYMVLENPMTYLGTTVSHPNLNRVAYGTTGIQMLKIGVITSSTGSPIQVTQFNLNTAGGGRDTANLASAKMYYTGNSKVFSTAVPFGSTHTNITGTSPSWDPYTFTGIQALSNDTNYFWLVYDLRSNAASATDSIDAVVPSFILSGVTEIVSDSAPTGNIVIRTPYCSSNPTSSTQEEIFNVTIGTINNTTDCFTTGKAGSVLNRYSDFSDLVTNVSRGTVVPFSVIGGSCNASNSNNKFGVYIDWNQNGSFTDAGDSVFGIPNVTGVNAGVTMAGNITVPCNAVLGQTRIRVIYWALAAGSPTSPCGTTNYFNGETEDYTLNILDNPIVPVAAVASQTNGFVAAGSTNNMIMRVAIKAQGCGTGILNDMYFQTTGSTNPGNDITEARLYKTGTSSTFDTTTLVGTVSAPNGAFSFNGLNATLLSSNLTDTNNFWLTYTISPFSLNGNIVDAVIDSIHMINTTIIPSNNNPSAADTVSKPMNYVSSSAVHPDLHRVPLGAQNVKVLKVMVVTSSNGAPVNLTDLTFSSVAGNDSINLDSARVFYTGNSNVFSTANQFGIAHTDTLTSWGTFTFTSAQPLMNDTNYFWLTYDINATGNPTDSIDAELISLTFDDTLRTPISGNPAGNILIRQDYCSIQSGTGLDININQVAIGGMVNSSTCSVPAKRYTDFTSVTPGSVQRNVASPVKVRLTDCNVAEDMKVAIFIDYNQDGDFIDAGETAFNDPTELLYPNLSYDDSLMTDIVVPCDALLGETRMRVVAYRSLNTSVSPCGTYTGKGEAEDYTITITDNPQVFISASAAQPSGLVAPGISNEVVMHLQIKTNGCGNGTLDTMYLNTGNSDDPTNDIVSVKLYSTGASTIFSNATLLDSVAAPSGAFQFAANDLLISYLTDTNNYWIVYDLSSSATLADTVDVRLDSMLVMGTMQVPSNNDPVEYKVIDYPMSYVSSTADYPGTDRVVRGTTHQMLRIQVVTGSIGSPINLTQFDLNANGSGGNIANVVSASMYYTGNSDVFATTTQFGSNYTPSSWGSYTITGSQPLMSDTNYFWLVYDVSVTAIVGDSIDAEVTAITIDGIAQTPTVTAPAGNAIIMAPYCAGTNYNGGRCITDVTFGNISNSTGSSCGLPYYNLFAATGSTTTTANIGSTIQLNITNQANAYMIAYIDFNRNGSFTDAGELFDLTGSNPASNVSYSVFIPFSAKTGDTRMRIRASQYPILTNTNPSCVSLNSAETEDYTITIVPEGAQTTYEWNQTTAADFTVPSNWTPSRTIAAYNDKLIFGTAGTTAEATNVFTQVVGSIEVLPNTQLILSAPSTAYLSVNDSLILGDYTTVTTNTAIPQVGTSVSKPGTLVIGVGAGINGTLKRFIGIDTSEYAFPLIGASGINRNVLVDYNNASNGGSITASFTPASPVGLAGLPLLDNDAQVNVDVVGREGYWSLIAGNGLTGGSYTGTFAVDSFSGLITVDSMVLIKRADPFSNWSLNGTHIATTGTLIHAVISRTGMSSFGEFALGVDSLIPTPTVYQWNQTSASSFNTASNWTPTRTAPAFNDRLVFGSSGSNLVVTNVPTQAVGIIEVTAGTHLTLSSTSTATLTALDSLVLGDNVLITANTVTLQTGNSTTEGVLVTGANAGIAGTIKRFILNTNPTIFFPIVDSKGSSRNATIDYTVYPTTTGSLTATYVETAPAGVSGLPLYDANAGVTVTKTAPDGYWEITPGNGLSGGYYNGAFAVDSFAGISDINRLVLLNRTGQLYNWTLNGTLTPPSGTVYNAVIGRSSMADFGQFAVGIDSVNMLPTTYEWNQSGAADFNTASNWTPSRDVPAYHDKLVFGTSGNNLVVNNVPSQSVGIIEVTAGTHLTLSASSANTLTATDSLVLGNNALVSSNTVLIQTGNSTIEGVLTTGTNAGIAATLKRFVLGVNPTVSFPIIDSRGINRKAVIDYTTLPTATGSLTATFAETAPVGTAGLPLSDANAGVTVTQTIPDGYWEITAGDGLAGGNYTGTFEVDSFTGISVVNRLVLMNRIDQLNNWILNGTHATSTGTVYHSLISRTGMTNYGQFAVGVDSVNTPSITYQWNQSGAADFNTASNWTPSRNTPAYNDRLVFGSSGNNLTITNVPTQAVRTIEVAAGTHLILSASSAATLTATDTLVLGNNALVSSGTVLIQTGNSTTEGVLTTGTNAGIAATLKRFVLGVNPTVSFPMIDSRGINRKAVIDYTTLPTATGSLTAIFAETTPAGTAGLPLSDLNAGVTINKIGLDGYWEITAGDGLTGGNYTGTFEVDSFIGVTSVSALVLVNRIDAVNNWILNGTYVTGTGSVYQAIISRTGMSDYGQFALGADSLTNPLPVNMVAFSAHAVNKNAVINWSTATEENSSHFVVERSVDGKTWIVAGRVLAKRYSSTLTSYEFTDVNAAAFAKEVYYRVRSVDNDGSFALSGIAIVDFNSSAKETVYIYPNPFTAEVSLEIFSAVNGSAQVTLTDITGKTIQQNIHLVKEGNNLIPMQNLDELKTGMYFITVTVNGTSFTQKVVKE